VTGSEVRRVFLKYFESNGHTLLPSSSLVPQGDPTLLFTNAGMVQFKKLFTGEEKRDFKRATTAQKCMRAGGKHNDFENVGKTARHHTFFEMLGNFSFGDYFKKEAIQLAWELVCSVFKLDKSRLWITIFQDDEDALQLWKKMGVPNERIVRMGEVDNFWSMGDTGPCGPCSEIIYDQGKDVGCGRPECSIGCDCDRFLEIWNLVFMQFERMSDGRLQPLPEPSIDTGMGLERITAVIQGVKSNYDTDLFSAIIKSIEELSGIEYGMDGSHDTAMRVIADHIRAIVMLIADGVVPSNDGRGYVLRRIIRRAERYGKKLNIPSPFLVKLSASVEKTLADQYSEIISRRSIINSIIEPEEEKFAQTLEKGIEIFNEEIKKLSGNVLPGELAFKLYDTYGFPVDITEDMAREAGLYFDRKGFESALEEQRARSRLSIKQADFRKETVYSEVLQSGFQSDFLGYDTTQAEGKIIFIVKNGHKVNKADEGEEIEIITDRTPFYGESGGQIGDTGIIKNDNFECEVIDTFKPYTNLIVHKCIVKRGVVVLNSNVFLAVDARRRADIAGNHTATHLLHAALRRVLGEHVKQSGSLVAPERLRFDFSHYSSLTQSQLRDIEDLVNEKIRENIAVETLVMNYNEAISTGALAFFDEKYGEKVRLVKIGDYSKELCGGTHVKNTGKIGALKIISEASISAGVRRIEAITGRSILEYLRELEKSIQQVEVELGTSKSGILDKINKLNERIKTLEKENAGLKERLTSSSTVVKNEWRKKIHGFEVVIQLLEDLDERAILNLGDKIKSSIKSGMIFLITKQNERLFLIAMVTDDLKHKYNAGKWLNAVASLLDGKGGGRADMARGSGKGGDINIAVDRAFNWVEEQG
jgi:alanyl-tRNA synthetase